MLVTREENPSHQPSAWVVAAALALVGSSVLSVAFFALRVGPTRIATQLMRLLLTIALAYFLVQGKTWARWLTVGLLGLGILVSLPSLWSVLRSANLLGLAFLGGLTATYVIVVGILLFSPGIGAHFAPRIQATPLAVPPPPSPS